MSKLSVLISGAGIAGPALAFHLAQTGRAEVTILEKATSLLPHGQNVDIDGKAARTVIDKMGLTEIVKQHHTTETGSQFVDSDGHPFALFPVRKGVQASLTSEYEILRGDLAKIFWEKTKDMSGVKYLLGTTIDRVVSNGPDSVEVALSDGQINPYDLVVLADGQWSKTRSQCFGSDTIQVIDKNMFGVYFTIPRLKEDNDWWNIYVALRSRIITTRPDPYGTIRALLSIMPCIESQKKEWSSVARAGRPAQMDLCRREFNDAGWQSQRLLEAMESAPDFYFQPIQQMKMDKWSNNRIICLGDTAFAPSPLTGMGTSLAITGAYVLAGELSLLEPDQHPQKAFEAYESKFRPFVEQTQHLPSFIPGIAHPQHAWSGMIFRNFIWLVSKVMAIPWIARKSQEEGPDDFVLPVYPAFEDHVQSEERRNAQRSQVDE